MSMPMSATNQITENPALRRERLALYWCIFILMAKQAMNGHRLFNKFHAFVFKESVIHCDSMLKPIIFSYVCNTLIANVSSK